MSVNLFDKTAATYDTYANASSDGHVEGGSTPGYFVSDYLAVTPGQQFTANQLIAAGGGGICYYDSAKTIPQVVGDNGGHASLSPFTVPSNSTIAFMRVTFQSDGTTSGGHAASNGLMLVLGDTSAMPSSYVAFSANAPTLTFAAIAGHIVGDAPFAVSATSPSSGAITYAIASGPATISGATVTLTGPGTVVLTATQAAAGSYGSGYGSITFTVAPAGSAPAGYVALFASRIHSDSFGHLLTGTLEVRPTDGNDTPITAAAGGAGGQMPANEPGVLAITNGALPNGAVIADTTQTRPANISYRLTFKDASGREISVLRGVQTQANTAFDLDAYTPNVPGQSVVTPGADGLSAYQLAVQNGFSGTLTQWLASLAGPPGSGALTSAQLARLYPFQGKRVLFCGDSITEGNYYPPTVATYHGLTYNYRQYPDTAITQNKGAWSGSTAYVAGDHAHRAGVWYSSLGASTSVDPATDDGTHWANSALLADNLGRSGQITLNILFHFAVLVSIDPTGPTIVQQLITALGNKDALILEFGTNDNYTALGAFGDAAQVPGAYYGGGLPAATSFYGSVEYLCQTAVQAVAGTGRKIPILAVSPYHTDRLSETSTPLNITQATTAILQVTQRYGISVCNQMQTTNINSLNWTQTLLVETGTFNHVHLSTFGGPVMGFNVAQHLGRCAQTF